MVKPQVMQGCVGLCRVFRLSLSMCAHGGIGKPYTTLHSQNVDDLETSTIDVQNPTSNTTPSPTSDTTTATLGTAER